MQCVVGAAARLSDEMLVEMLGIKVTLGNPLVTLDGP